MPSQHSHRHRSHLVLFATFAVVLACVFWTGTAAGATVLYYGSDVETRIWSGEVKDLRTCVDDARDGTTINSRAACGAITVTKDGIELEKVGVWIRKDIIPRATYTGRDVTVAVSGKYVTPFMKCLTDAQDGSIDDISSCSQVAVSGNLVTFIDVTVTVRG